MNALETVKRLSNDELVLRISDCVREERRLSALLLAQLGEIDARGLYRDLGYESLFAYAVEGLRMSESEAGLRIIAARFARKYPDSLEMLSRGELHLTAMKLLSRAVTDENRALLALARHKTKHEIQLLIAKHCPQPDAPAVIRRLPTAPTTNSSKNVSAPCPPASDTTAAGTASVPKPVAKMLFPISEATEPQPRVASAFVSLAGRGLLAPEQSPHAESARTIGEEVRPPQLATTPNAGLALTARTPSCNREPATATSEGRYKIQFTAGQHVRDLINQAQDLFRNQLPSGDIGVLFERALELLVAERKKQVFAQTSKEHRSRSAKTSAASTQTLADFSPTAMATISSERRDPASVGSGIADANGSSAAPRVASAHNTANGGSRHIPNDVKRRVFERDGGQCRFVSASGKRCSARGRLEFHHVHAFGLGGAATASNIVLCCRAHNRLFAERDFTREHIERCVGARQAARIRARNEQAATSPGRAFAIHASSPQPESSAVWRLTST